MRNYPASRGFSLIELMIAVAIVGILSTIAYPSYTDYLRRGKIPEATSALSEARVKLEQYYQDNRNYGSTASACGIGAIASTANFSFACTWGSTGNDQSFVVTATGLGNMSWLSFTINQANARASTVTSGPAGWASNSACWITKKGGIC